MYAVLLMAIEAVPTSVQLVPSGDTYELKMSPVRVSLNQQGRLWSLAPRSFRFAPVVSLAQDSPPSLTAPDDPDGLPITDTYFAVGASVSRIMMPARLSQKFRRLVSRAMI